MTPRTRRPIRSGAAALGLALVASAGLVGVSTTVPAGAAPAAALATADVVDTAAGAGQFTTLLAAAQAAGLVDALKAPGPITVFAPTDAAFTAFLTKAGLTAEQLLANKPLLAFVLKYHVVAGAIRSGDLSTFNGPTTLAGPPMLVIKGPKGVQINGYSTVTTADLEASNGVIHVVAQVLLPFIVR